MLVAIKFIITIQQCNKFCLDINAWQTFWV